MFFNCACIAIVSANGIKPIKALKKAGSNGFFVKITASGKDYSMEILLINAVSENLPSSLFEIPEGYSKSNEKCAVSYNAFANQ